MVSCEKCGAKVGRRHDVDCPNGRVMMGLDTHGAPRGETVEERLRLWAKRERETKERYVAWVDELQWRLREDRRRD